MFYLKLLLFNSLMLGEQDGKTRKTILDKSTCWLWRLVYNFDTFTRSIKLLTTMNIVNDHVHQEPMQYGRWHSQEHDSSFLPSLHLLHFPPLIQCPYLLMELVLYIISLPSGNYNISTRSEEQSRNYNITTKATQLWVQISGSYSFRIFQDGELNNKYQTPVSMKYRHEIARSFIKQQITQCNFLF